MSEERMSIDDAFGHGGLDVENVPQREGRDFELLPVGWILAQIEDVCKMPIKNSTNGGYRYNFTFSILDERYSGRKVFENLNVFYPEKETTQLIALQDYRDLLMSIGAPLRASSKDIIEKILQINIRVVPKNGNYEARNGVKGYRPASGETLKPVKAEQPSAPAQTKTKPATQAKPATDNRLPWQK
jgi:hypothetical protein